MEIARNLIIGILFSCIQLMVSQPLTANHLGSGAYFISHQYLEVANDSIPRNNPYRRILDQPRYKRNIQRTSGMLGVGVGLGTAGTAAAVTYIVTMGIDSWGAVYAPFVIGMIAYPVGSSIATANGVVNGIKLSAYEEYRVYGNAFLTAMVVTAGVQFLSISAAVSYNEPIFMLGVLAGSFIGANAGTAAHINALKQRADVWDRRNGYVRINSDSVLYFRNRFNGLDLPDSITVNPFENLLDNKEYDKAIYRPTITTGVLTSIAASTVLFLATEGSDSRNADKKFSDYDFKSAILGATIFGTFATTAVFNHSVNRNTTIVPFQRYNTNLNTTLATSGTFAALYITSELTGSPLPKFASLVAAPIAGAYVGMNTHKKNLQYSSSSWDLSYSKSWLHPNMIPESSIGLELVPDLSDPTIDMDVGSIRQSVVPVVKMTWRF